MMCAPRLDACVTRSGSVSNAFTLPRKKLRRGGDVRRLALGGRAQDRKSRSRRTASGLFRNTLVMLGISFCPSFTSGCVASSRLLRSAAPTAAASGSR